MWSKFCSNYFYFQLTCLNQNVIGIVATMCLPNIFSPFLKHLTNTFLKTFFFMNIVTSSTIYWTASSVGQTKNCKLVFCCSNAKQTALRIKGYDWVAPNQKNMYQWNHLWTIVSVSINPTQRVGLVQSRTSSSHQMYIVIPLPTKLQRDIVMLPSVLP